MWEVDLGIKDSKKVRNVCIISNEFNMTNCLDNHSFTSSTDAWITVIQEIQFVIFVISPGEYKLSMGLSLRNLTLSYEFQKFIWISQEVSPKRIKTNGKRIGRIIEDACIAPEMLYICLFLCRFTFPNVRHLHSSMLHIHLIYYEQPTKHSPCYRRTRNNILV